MIALFVDDAPRLLASMRDALQQGNMPELQRFAHSMKGAASNLSALVTTAAALELETNAQDGDAESSKVSLTKLAETVQHLLPALAELSQEVSK